MCGIAGLIHRGKSSNIGEELTAMLQSLKHRGPDSTGFALYGNPMKGKHVMRFKVAEQEDVSKGFDIIHQMPDPEKVDTIRRFMRFYLTNPVDHSGCPFLDQGVCGIYKFRTFACRAYGLWSRQIGDNRTENSRQGRSALIEQWKRLGLELPAERVEFEIDYCDRVECTSQPVVRLARPQTSPSQPRKFSAGASA